jgi:PAS domain S-box-containing protein
MPESLQNNAHSDISHEEQASRYRALVDSMNDGFGIINNEGIFTYVNQRFASILEYSPDHMIGKHIVDFLDDKNKKTLRDNIRRRTEGQATQYELEWTKKSGEHVPTIVSGAPYINDDGQITGSFAVITDITEIKQSRQALEDSAELMKSIFEESQIGIEIFDKNGILITANRAALEIAGLSNLDELVGFSLFDDPNLPSEIKACLIRGKPVQYETEFDFGKVREAKLYDTNRTGKIILDAFITPLGITKENGGEITGYLGQIWEKTEHRRVEEALVDSEKRYQLLAENVSDVIFTSDLELNLTYVSQSAEMLLGYNNDELMGKSLIELMTPESVWVAIEAIRKALEIDKQQPEQYSRSDSPPLELQLKKKEGSLVWVEITRTFMRDDNQVPIGVIGVARNIEERKHAQETLVDSELKYRSLINQSFQGIMIIQALPLKILFTNPAFAAFLDCTVEEVLNLDPLSIRSMIHPEDLDIVMTKLQELMNGDNPNRTPIVIRVFQKGGDMQSLEMFGRKVDYEGMSAIQIVAMNVSDRLNAEKRVRTQKERAMLYLDLMSHDFRNQLQIILGSTMVMDSRLENPDDRRILDQIILAVERCQRMILKAKVTEPLMSVPLRPTKLAPILEKVVMQQVDLHSDVDIGITLKDADAIVDADEFLEQLFANLIENAIEHNPRAERQVWVNLRKKGKEYEVTVADNGSGISESLKKEIFDISRRYGGLGLHQSRQICEKYGGRISVRDRVPENPNQGVEFVVWIPKARNSSPI